MPDDLDNDEKLSNYLQQCILLEMVKNKIRTKTSASVTKQKAKAIYVDSSDDEETDSD